MLATDSFVVSLWHHAPTWVNVLLLTAATLSAATMLLHFAWSRVIKPAVKVSEVVPPLTKLAEVAPQLQAVATIAVTLEEIAQQFKNNGGSSMRDSVDRIETKLVKQGDRSARIETTLAEQGDRSARIETKLVEQGERSARIETTVAGHSDAIDRMARAAQRQMTHAEETRVEIAGLTSSDNN